MKKLKSYQAEVFLFLLAIILHTLIVIVAFQAYRAQNPEEGYELIYERMTTAGDAPHYLYLAQEGYQSEGEKANLIVFYPLYPFLMRVLAKVLLLGNYELAGILISQIGTGIATIFLYRLVRLDYEENRAVEAVLLFLTYPFMMFTMGIFTEGLFLVLVTAALYCIRKHQWGWTGFLGLAAALCRAQGILLLAPALYELIGWQRSKGTGWKKCLDRGQLALALIPMGFIFYLFLNLFLQGDCFAFYRHQSAPPWYQSTQWMNANLTKDFGMAQEYRVLGYFIYWVQIVLFFVAVATLLYGIHKQVRSSLIVFGGIYTCFCYLPGWLISGARYMMGCVPMFIVFAAIDHQMVRRAILILNAALCMLYMILFLQGQAIM